ncbi:MAG: DUF4838 domain-containing protein [Planctomycetia bacterium]|nr:DUF4838 domain-containing protein [Planctomycetia bacterium]
MNMPNRKLLALFLVALALVVSNVGSSSADEGKPAASQAGANGEANVEATLAKMRALVSARQWNDLIGQFQDEDLAAWKNVAPAKVSAAAGLRGKAYAVVKDVARAEKDLKLAVERSPKNGEHWHELGTFYESLPTNAQPALEAYEKSFQCAGKSSGWLPLSATIHSATILLKQGKHREAQQVMERYDSSDLLEMAPIWGDKMRALNEQINEKLGTALLTIAEKGASDYQIVLPDNYPTPDIGADMQQVARLLQTAFKANGAELAVTTESARDVAKPALYLGNTAFARKHGVDMSQSNDWSYVHKAIGRDIILAGCDEAAPGRGPNTKNGPGFDRIGTAKAVVDFLQLYVGTRFLFPENRSFLALGKTSAVDLLTTPTIEYLPTTRIAVPPDLDVKKLPVLDYDITWPPTVSFYNLAQNRFPVINTTFGGHTWHRAIPSDEAAFAAHPEHFALLGGKRVLNGSGGQVQFCISNPEVQKLLYEDLEKHFKQGFRNVDIGQPDGFRGCECEACTKLFGTGSDWSEKIWILHRRLAERAQREYPDRIVTIAVYAVTETLPKTFDSFPPNVRLGLCGTRDPEIAAWKNFGAPQGFTTYLYYWCPNMMPRYFPMRTPLYVEKAAKRLMAAEVHSITRDGNGGIAYGLEGPTYYTMGKMFDGRDAHSAKSLVIEYVGAAFGKSAPAMMSFYDQLYRSLEIYSSYMATREDGWAFKDMYGRGHKHLSSPESVIAFLYPVELVQALEKQLALAEKADASPKVQTRLALVRKEFDYLKGVVKAVHLYNAYQISPDTGSLDRLLGSIDALRAEVDKLFAKGSGPQAWPYTLFPPTGHGAAMLKLTYDGYQEPYKSSFFNWDTTAKRQAPLPNAKQLLAAAAKETVLIDSPRWESVAAQPLLSTNAANAKPLSTQVRALYDDRQLYLRFESDLPAGAAPEAVERERMEAYLMPVAGSPVTYRFAAGLKPDSRTQAARGLIEDLMNLGYGKFDTLWRGEWTHTAAYDPQAHRLTVLMTIPVRSIPPAAIKQGTNWFVNFRRTTSTESVPGETYVWSLIPGGTPFDDPRSNGELSFSVDGGAASSAVHPLKLIREKGYRDSFEVPDQWKARIDKGPSLVLKDWKFRADPSEIGEQEEWFKPARYSEADWIPIQVPSYWAENEAIGNLLGDGWYRVPFAVPQTWQDKTLRLMFAGVDEQAWIYLNGKLVGEHSEKSEKKAFTALYDEPFIVDVPAGQLKLGEQNVLYVRVHNKVGAGGIWRPLHAVEAQASEAAR